MLPLCTLASFSHFGAGKRGLSAVLRDVHQVPRDCTTLLLDHRSITMAFGAGH